MPRTAEIARKTKETDGKDKDTSVKEKTEH